VSVEDIIKPVNCFVLDVGGNGNPANWKPVGGTPVPNIGNGGDGSHPELILLYPDGAIETAQVFNGTNNPDKSGTFNSPPEHAPSQGVIAAFVKT